MGLILSSMAGFGAAIWGFATYGYGGGLQTRAPRLLVILIIESARAMSDRCDDLLVFRRNPSDRSHLSDTR